MKKVELLAPAGSLEKAKIAFMYGADAVYAGTSKLSLRSRAEMESDDLEETINYAHKIGKKVYVALNIYAYDNDYDEIKNQIERLKKIKPDGIIVSDPGIIAWIKENAKELDIHISTQANVTSLESAKFWYNYGAKRVILSRELSYDKIKYMMENKPKDLEVEMFIHGAICYAYSGRCYLSQYLSDRGANCGDCSQPCRWQYKLTAEEVNKPGSVINIDYDEKGTYIFSSKDLCLLKQLPKIIDMGMDSLKIEGRLKTDYYLATVVRSYRKAIDDYYENKDNWDYMNYLPELEKVKTRGLSEFYFTDPKNQDIHDFDGFSENLKYEYGARVKEVLENNLYLVEIRNKLSLGDTLDVMIPNDILPHEFQIEELYDSKTKESITHVNPGVKGQDVIIKVPYKMEKDYIIRRKK